ncbi:Plant organelle RNA recognition domain [Musa troglodytarum]|uniref:Plant organelle RNA recognition domain n=1 Tax=Musa troglodytarum TaxID=320322 RepID=A0A9E7HV33_9LILI|nr:Plant organelle RNA recognition domain [Musa troglodytarum]
MIPPIETALYNGHLPPLRVARTSPAQGFLSGLFTGALRHRPAPKPASRESDLVSPDRARRDRPRLRGGRAESGSGGGGGRGRGEQARRAPAPFSLPTPDRYCGIIGLDKRMPRPPDIGWQYGTMIAQRTSEQQFEIGTRGFIDAFSCIQYKDEQDFMPTRATDIGWAHGAMVNGDRQKIECKYCHKVILGGGISRLKQHLAGERGNIAPCDQVPDDVKAQMQQHLGFKVLENCNAQQNTEEYNGDALKVTPISPTAASHRRRGKDEGYSKKRKKVEMLRIPQGSTFPLSTVQLSFASQEIIDQADIAVAKFMYESGIPLSAANSVYFQRMADAIAAVGPGYKMPSHHSLKAAWWSMYASDYPDLQRFAVRILSQTCRMPAFRRNCYINEYAHSSKNRLERARLNDTTFVHYNLHLQEGQPVATESKGLINGENDLLSISSYDAGDWIEDPGILEVEGINLLDVTLPGGPLPVIDKAGNTSDGNLVIDD